MPGEGEKEPKGGKGFAGLSALVSDVDSDIAKDSETVHERPPPSQATHPQPNSDSVRGSAGQEPRSEPNQQSPALQSTGSSVWKWILGIGAAVGLVWLVSSGSGNKNNPVPVQGSSPSGVPAQAPSQNVDRSKSMPPQPITRSAEEKPPTGTSNVLNPAQIRYCLSEDIRLRAAETIVNTYIEAEVIRFNAMVADYNSRCSQFKYRSGAIDSVRADVEANKSRLEAEGRSRFTPRQEPTYSMAENRKPASSRISAEDFLNAPGSVDPLPSIQKNVLQGNAGQDELDIGNRISAYYQAVQDNRVESALNMYASFRKPAIRRNRIEAVAKDTEYYRIEKIDVLNVSEKNASALIYLFHKKHGKPEEYWEITFKLLRENGSWNIIETPGKKLK
jgi:hypothetical protein